MRNGLCPLALLALIGAAACGEQPRAAPAPEPETAKPLVPDIRFPRLPGNMEEPAASGAGDRRLLEHYEYRLREYVDLVGRVSPFPARVNGTLQLLETDHRAVVRISTSRLLEGTTFKAPVFQEASGTWRRDGDHVVVEGLNLALGDNEVFRPRGEARRWRIERDGLRTVVHAEPLTFEQTISR